MPRKIMAVAVIAALGMVIVASSPADARGGFGLARLRLGRPRLRQLRAGRIRLRRCAHSGLWMDVASSCKAMSRSQPATLFILATALAGHGSTASGHKREVATWG